MVKKLLLLLAALLAAVIPAVAQNARAQAYVERYAGYAVLEMHRSGVPASITLAQGMLESGYGTSRLAREANNHFGIQCHRNWTGERIKEMDNGELRDFRVYDSPLDSYRDHSDFLRGNRRYASLFELKRTDYKGWAKGLKKAGYAENPKYADLLIDLVEQHDLTRYDKMSLADGEKLVKQAGDREESEPAAVSSDSGSKDKKSTKEERRRKRRRQQRRDEQILREGYEEIQTETPAALEAPKRVTKDDARVRFSMSRPMYRRGGTLCVQSVEGETYASIARSFNLFLREILRFNDLREERDLAPGTYVYIEAKARQAVRGLNVHVVQPGETLWDIAQLYGVKEKSLRKLNGYGADDQPESGEMVRLRKRAGDNPWWAFWK